ncbi:lysophospholipid acyltransferase family protein [Natroniella sulfidigena]|uniref:lysophospholipid acyltransferase family protein n=1 Tax=Natroniella sulfidigena TaxID=723921 RepID=UPI00200A09EF|nr:lysophospholipid acyltransferase family protein [Natroniella sulfidigena]MCK8816353.1 lysophospholipid acyltransferase family protein [Natroniella sulfidigena]
MKEQLKLKLIPNSALLLAKVINSTLSLEVQGAKRVNQLLAGDKSVIFAPWHGQLWLPSYYLRNQGYVALASQSRDGEYISRLLNKLGWEVVRGSTSRGGARSLLKLVKKLRQGKQIAITPDGPRGPIHQVKPGVVYLAQKTDSIIIPIGVSYTKKKEFSSWDRFWLPAPFSKAALVFGAGLEIKEDKLSTVEIENYQKLLGQKINQAGQAAEKILGD